MPISQPKRPHRIEVRLSDHELERLHAHMATASTTNREAFLRQLIADGYVLRVNFKELAELLYLQGNISNNINQIAKKLNQGGLLINSDTQQIVHGYEQLQWQVSRITDMLSQLS